MPKVSSSYDLEPQRALGLEIEVVLESLKGQLGLELERQQAGLELNKSADCTAKSKFSNASARRLALPVGSATTGRPYPEDEMSQSEVYRVLSTYQQRLAIAEVQEAEGFELAYEDRPPEFKFVKRALWDNIRASKELPSFPEIRTPRLVLSKSSSQYCWVFQNGQDITMFLTTIAGDCALEFKIPNKVYQQYRGWKATRPNIQLGKKGNLRFIFSLENMVEEDDKELFKKSDSALGVDIGIRRSYAAVRATSDGEALPIGATSLEVYRCQKALDKVNRQLDYLVKRNRQRARLGHVKENAVVEESRLRAKRARIIESLDWQAAADVVDISEPGEVIGLEELRWGKGGPVKFRHRQQQDKVEHLARKRGRRVKKVRAKGMSHECPECGEFLEPGRDRVSVCESSGCGYVGDRDDTAGAVIGFRALGGSSQGVRKVFGALVGKPVPRRVLKVRTGFTGPSPAIQSAVVGNHGTSLAAGYCSPVGTVGRDWLKRSEDW